MPRFLLALVLLSSAASCAIFSAASAYPIAGLTPSERPEGAPKITEFERSAEWREIFFKGIEEPYPESLSWAQDQGAWYTPFNRPGMTGPYDLRGWHE